MEAKFTSGPWSVAQTGVLRTFTAIIDARGRWLADCTFNKVSEEYYPLQAEAEANAALIAAAPELYEALKEMVLFYEGAFTRDGALIDRARSALSRVEQTGKRDE